MSGPRAAIRSKVESVSPETRARVASWARLIGFVVLAAWIVGGPIYKQLLGGKTKWVRPWVMYSGNSVGVVAARFETVDKKGRRKPLDHYELLDATPPFSFDERPDKSVSMIRTKAKFQKLVDRICRKLRRRTELRAVARIGRKGGWKPLEDGERNLCAKRNAPSKSLGKRGRGARG